MPGADRTTSCGDVDGVLLTRVQGADLVFLHWQGAVVSGVCFSFDQCPRLVECAWCEYGGFECDEAYAGGGGAGFEAQQAGGRDVERGRQAAEGVGGGVAFLGVFAGGVGAYPGDAVEGGAADLPARGVEFQADGAAEVVDREVDGACVGAVGVGGLCGVAPA